VRRPAITAWTLLAGIEVADQLGDDDRPLIFVAMIAAFEDHRRAAAVPDHRDRDPGGAPGILVRRVRDHDEAGLLAGTVEVDGDEGAARALRGDAAAHFADAPPV
jgi:hypothetical protein